MGDELTPGPPEDRLVRVACYACQARDQLLRSLFRGLLSVEPPLCAEANSDLQSQLRYIGKRADIAPKLWSNPGAVLVTIPHDTCVFSVLFVFST